MNETVYLWWLGYLLASPIRKFMQDSEKILTSYIQEGDTTLNVGSAMGFFSLPMARLVGERGRVVCIDLQEKMIKGLKKRARRAGLIGRMDLRVCGPNLLCIDDLAGSIDFALAFAVVHEVPDAKSILTEIYAALRRRGASLLSEPTGLVSENAFEDTLSLALSTGFRVTDTTRIRRNHSRQLVGS
jgi:ubiquinone/menaquinone biosynthesis C-methylase UbiE